MSQPTEFERQYYAKLIGRKITAILWDDLDGLALPILVLSGRSKDGAVPTVTVLADPEGNGPGHLDHTL